MKSYKTGYEETPYRKKSKKKTPKKADHVHISERCIFEYMGKKCSKERGIYDAKVFGEGAYCPKCGKVMKHPFQECAYIPGLPVFWLEDNWFTKSVDLNERK